jgi:hypothetical protein
MLSAAEQTKKSWAEKLSSYEEIPAVFLPFLKTLPIKAGTFPLTILTPTYEGFLRRRLAKKLVTHVGDSIYIVEDSTSGLTITEHNLAHINCIEEASFLLRSWLRIYSAARDKLATTTLEFNTVSMGLFRPMIQAARQGSPPSAEGHNPERDKFNHLIRQDYKFMNYARRSLLSDETVCSFVLQPEISKPLLRGLGLEPRRTIVPKHICILTDKELILIREDFKLWWHVGPNYGGIWQYIPLSKISSLELKSQGDEMLALTVNLPGDQIIEPVFSASFRDELQHLVDEFVAIRPSLHS